MPSRRHRQRAQEQARPIITKHLGQKLDAAMTLPVGLPDAMADALRRLDEAEKAPRHKERCA